MKQTDRITALEYKVKTLEENPKGKDYRLVKTWGRRSAFWEVQSWGGDKCEWELYGFPPIGLTRRSALRWVKREYGNIIWRECK